MLTLLAAAPAMASVGDTTEFPLPEQSHPWGVAAGPDGRIWVSERNGWLARLTTDGAVDQLMPPAWAQQFPAAPAGIAAGADGNLWVAIPACCDGVPDQVARISTGGDGTPFDVPEHGAGLSSMTAGLDGNVWFTEELTDKIGRVDPNGHVVAFGDGMTGHAWPQGISVGPDGNLWFAENATNKIGRITPEGVIHEFSGGISGSAGLEGTAPGTDGAVWFTNGNGSVGRITPAGVVTEFPTPTSASGPVAIALGPDGNVWFTESSASKVGRVTPSGVITEFPLSSRSQLYGIAAGPDGNMWVTEWGADAVARIGTGAPAAVEAPPSVGGSGVVGEPLTCSGERWADYAGVQPVADPAARPVDGVRWLLDGALIDGARDRTYLPKASDAGHVASCRVTATYPLLGLPVSAQSANSVTVRAAPVAEPPPGTTTGDVLRIDVRHGAFGDRRYSLACRPPAGDVRRAADVCAALARRPALLVSASGRHRPCRTVRVAGRFAGRRVSAGFAHCVGSQRRNELAWLRLLGYGIVRLRGSLVLADGGVGPLRLGEHADRVERDVHGGRLLPSTTVRYEIGAGGSAVVRYDGAGRITRIDARGRRAIIRRVHVRASSWRSRDCGAATVSVRVHGRTWTVITERAAGDVAVTVATGRAPRGCRGLR